MMSRIFSSLCILALFVPATLGIGATLIHGELYVELMASVYKGVHENGTCYDVDSESVQNVQAVTWIMNQMNANNYYSWSVPGLGLRVSTTCGSAARAESLAYDLSVELSSLTKGVIGVLGPEFSSETEAVSRLLGAQPAASRLLQVTYASTSASLRNADVYRNLFRTIPPDDLQARVMTQFLQEIDWTYVAIIYDDNVYGRGGKDALINDVTSSNICFSALIPVSSYDVSALQNQIRAKIINADVPVGGAIVFGSYTLATTVLTATENVLTEFPNVTLPTFLFSEAGGYLEGLPDPIAKGIFVLSPPKKVVQDFQTYWRSLFTDVQNIYNEAPPNRDWLRAVYSERFGCTLPANIADNTCPVLTDAQVLEKIPPSVYNQYAIQASLIMAKIVKTVHDTKCPGTTNNPCTVFNADRQAFIDVAQDIVVDFDNDFGAIRIDEFKDELEKPSLVVSFTADGEASFPVGFPLYEIYNHQVCASGKMCLQKVANLTSTGLNFYSEEVKDYDSNGNETSWPDIRKPQCPDTYVCSSCLSRDATDSHIFFLPGDMYIVGIVPVHNPGVNPLQCGSIKGGALDIVEVIQFAVADARKIIRTKIPTGKIGIVIIDSCNDPQIVQEKVLTLHRLGVLQDGAYIPVADKIIGYIGGWSSGVSSVTADITSRLDLVQIAYASTASSLSDSLQYPYFMRTPTPDNYQADTMLKIVKDFNANLIQIVHSSGTYGIGGRDTLLSLIEGYDICVADVHAVTTKTNPAVLANKLRQFKGARVILMFISSFDADAILGRLNDNLFPDEFIFIASDGWGTRSDVTGLRNLIGSITLTSEHLQVNEKFKTHMKELTPDGANVDPWIREYMEQEFDCYYQWSYDKQSGSPCLGTERLDVYTTAYRIDAWSSYAERAVLALLQGARQALESECGRSDTVCEAFRNNPQTLFNLSKVVEFVDGVVRSRAFNDNGDGTAGYEIYAVDGNNLYTKVGSSDLLGTESEISFQKGQYPGSADLNSSCANQAVCSDCFPKPIVAGESECFSTALIAVIVVLAVISLILTVILIFVCTRLGCCIKMEDGKPKLNENYITPVYLKRPLRQPEPQENYDSINDMYRHQSTTGSGSGSGGSRFGPRNDSGMSTGSRGTNNMNPSGGSYFSAGSSKTSGSGGGSNGRGGYIQPEPQLPSPRPHSKPESGGEKVEIDQGGGMSKVVYQQDGSYITSPGRPNVAFQDDELEMERGEMGQGEMGQGDMGQGEMGQGEMGQGESDGSRQQMSQDSDKSLGYLRSVQSVNC